MSIFYSEKGRGAARRSRGPECLMVWKSQWSGRVLPPPSGLSRWGAGPAARHARLPAGGAPAQFPLIRAHGWNRAVWGEAPEDSTLHPPEADPNKFRLPNLKIQRLRGSVIRGRRFQGISAAGWTRPGHDGPGGIWGIGPPEADAIWRPPSELPTLGVYSSHSRQAGRPPYNCPPGAPAQFPLIRAHGWNREVWGEAPENSTLHPPEADPNKFRLPNLKFQGPDGRVTLGRRLQGICGMGGPPPA